MAESTRTAPPASSPRSRFREQIRAEAKVIALRQLAEGGLPAVSINAIAKELGVSGPALYRYFKGRDDLLDQLVVDAYADLEATVRASRPDPRGGTSPLAAYAAAYRGWAREHPHRYRLLFGQPNDLHDGHSPELVAAAERLMIDLVGVLEASPAAPSATRKPDPQLADQLRAWAASRGIAVEPPVAFAAISAWAELHGWARLEIDGNFASMGLDPARLPGRPTP